MQSLPGRGVVGRIDELSEVAYLGSRIEYVVATPWGELLVFDEGARAPFARGSTVGIAFDPDAVIVLPGHAG